MGSCGHTVLCPDRGGVGRRTRGQGLLADDTHVCDLPSTCMGLPVFCCNFLQQKFWQRRQKFS